MERYYITENGYILAFVAALLPLLGFIELFFFAKPGKGSRTAICYSAFSFLVSVYVFTMVWNGPVIHEQFRWFTVGQVSFSAGILLNNLSVLMMVLISAISLLVHVYSSAYMKHDPALHRYWAYLGLFCFAMMSLVIADNLLIIYLFWELVGFSSYLLIGFWTTREAAVRANKKAFIINRIGDLGFLAGILVLYTQFQTLDIDRLFGNLAMVQRSAVSGGWWITATSHLPVAWLTFAGVAFFLGAMAKSAQFPLHTWLPDAMEGPTPVSSLIHAATMVAAGVFLLVRVFPLFNETVLLIITVTGAFTAFMAASIALVQHDIKKILAYSTISQLGFMMVAVGMGASDMAMFHLSTHAFFKCLLFLAAGAVIHELQHVKEKGDFSFDPQDIRSMGGLRKKMPVTCITMIVAALALAGFPLTSGYLSKDAILVHTFEWGVRQSSWMMAVPYLMFITSLLTVFYIARLIIKAFFGENRVLSPGTEINEAPRPMVWPLIILAICCLYPLFSSDVLEPGASWIISGLPSHSRVLKDAAFHHSVPLLISLGSVIVLALAWFCYGRKTQPLFRDAGFLYRFAFNGWYLDRLYAVSIVQPVLFISRFSYGFDRRVVDGIVHLIGRAGLLLSALALWLDRYVIDAAVNFLGQVSKTIGNFARRFHSGLVQYYLLITVCVVLLFFMFKYFVR